VFCFSLASGFALTFGAVASSPPPNFLTAVPLLLLAIIALARRAKVSLDRLFDGAALFVLAGFMAIPVFGAAASPLAVAGLAVEVPVANVLINTGADFFMVTFFVVLASLASRNQLGAVVVIASGQAAVTVGTLAGAMLGNFTNSIAPDRAFRPLILAVLLALAFVAFLLLGLRGFSFERTINQLKPAAKPVVSAAPPKLEPACEAVSEHYGLTPREREVLALLARGRNASSIQDLLTISRNTVKTHIKNVYAKLEVHSQQELIDLVEQGDSPP
jgi:DNA-binding CsgD family transcriptional regulator